MLSGGDFAIFSLKHQQMAFYQIPVEQTRTFKMFLVAQCSNAGEEPSNTNHLTGPSDFPEPQGALFLSPDLESLSSSYVCASPLIGSAGVAVKMAKRGPPWAYKGARDFFIRCPWNPRGAFKTHLATVGSLACGPTCTGDLMPI